MRRLRPLVIAFLAFAALIAAAPATRAAPRLLPEPRRVTLGSGRFAIHDGLVIAVASGDEEDRFAAGLLAEEIAAATGIHAQVTDAKSGAIVLDRAGAPAEIGDQGYRIDAQSSGVRIVARTAAGIFYGVQTLCQMIEPDGIPAATIVDWPALRWRGVNDDLSRGPVPTLESLERRVRTAAQLKFNLYALYFETSFAYKSQPLLAPPGGALDEREVRELVAYARRYHVELLPEQQTIGHLHQVLRYESYSDLAEVPNGSTLAPQAKSSAFVRSMYDELAPIFPGPFLHIGADEIGELGQGRSHDQVEKLGQVETYLAQLRALHDQMSSYGKQLIFWSDICHDHPEIIPKLPRDLIAASWCYGPADDYGPWIKPFRDAGLDVIVCPGVSNWNRVFPNLDIALPNIRAFIREGQRGTAIGALTCVWFDDGDGLFGMNWYALAFAAAASWQSGDCDPARVRQTFDWAFFRNPGTEVADAIEQINSAHRIIHGIRPTDASTQLAWLNPLRGAPERQTMLQIEPAAVALRLAQERAIALIGQARLRGRLHAEVLDEFAFGARRLHYIGLKAIVARRVPEFYQQLVAALVPGQPALASIQKLAPIFTLIADAREAAVALRAEHERLWLVENRPYWFGNLTAQYDRDIQVWLDRLDGFRYCEAALRAGRRPPAASELGIGP